MWGRRIRTSQADELAGKVGPLRSIRTRQVHVELNVSEGRFRNGVLASQRVLGWKQQTERLKTDKFSLDPRRMGLRPPIRTAERNVELGRAQLEHRGSEPAAVPPPDLEVRRFVVEGLENVSPGSAPLAHEVEKNRSCRFVQLSYDPVVERHELASSR
jgi:hypothetical protein